MINSKNKIFKQFIKTNNKIIASIAMSDILKEKILKPIEQRIQDTEKIKEIIDIQDKYYKKNNEFNFLGLINIHCCKEDNQNYLVDGQHRFTAATKLFNMEYNPILNFELIEVETLDELRKNYTMINQNTELPEFPDNIDKNIPEQVAQYFFSLYPKIWRSGKKPTRPFINKNHFQEALGYLTLKLNDALPQPIDIEDLKNIILEKNNKMKNWPILSYEKNIRKMKKWPEYKEKADDLQFYLGMYPMIGEEYTYEWIKDIIKENTGEIIKKRKRNIYKKRKIPQQIRQQVWTKYMGNVSQGKCYCCRITELKQLTNYQCGHVKSEKEGGTIDIKNLRPICISCNSSMGTQHMRQYILENYKNNLSLFDNEISPIKCIITKSKRKKSYFKKLFTNV